MAHHIYTTDAYILDSTPSGEADKFFTLFTLDLGLVRAVGKSVRHGRSKLRYSLQDFSRSRISLVRGKEVWRITSARLEDNTFSRYKENREVMWVIAQIFALVRRLMGEEEKNEHLFDVVHSSLEFLHTHTLSRDELKGFEIITVLKILDELGYMGAVPTLRPLMVATLTPEALSEAAERKSEALKEINMSLRETQL